MPSLDRIDRSTDEWKQSLSPEQYQVARCGGTERAFTGKYWDNKATGVYHCVCCGTPLFSSTTKFESGTGWPSFWDGISPEAITTKQDVTHGMVRTEITCSRCDGHLGHVFSDGPAPTGQRSAFMTKTGRSTFVILRMESFMDYAGPLLSFLIRPRVVASLAHAVLMP